MEQMWDSSKEVEEINVKELKWNLELPWWTTDGKLPYNLTPKEVLDQIDKYPGHKERIFKSEIKYPLLIVKTKQDRWLIYDGAHRFVRQLLEGKESVLVKKFSIEDMSEYIHDTHKERFKEWKRGEYK